MNDAVKQTGGVVASGMGLFGAITLNDVNLYVSIACGFFGTIAAILTIVSWFKARRKK